MLNMLRFDWSLSHRNRRKYYLSTKNKSCSSNQSWSGIPSSLYPTHHTPIPIPAEPASTLYHSSKTPRTNRCRATLSFVLTSAPLLLFTGQKETAFCPPAGCRRLECRPSHLPEPSQHPSGEKTCLRQTLGAQKSIVPRCTYGIEVLYSIYYCMIAVVRGIVYTAVVPGRVYSRVRVAQQTEACWAPRRAFGRAPWEDLRSARDICVAMCPKTLKSYHFTGSFYVSVWLSPILFPGCLVQSDWYRCTAYDPAGTIAVRHSLQWSSFYIRYLAAF